jgi:hypothetical protein
MPPMFILPPKAPINVCKIEDYKTRVTNYFHNVKLKIPQSLIMYSRKTTVDITMLLPLSREKHR